MYGLFVTILAALFWIFCKTLICVCDWDGIDDSVGAWFGNKCANVVADDGCDRSCRVACEDVQIDILEDGVCRIEMSDDKLTIFLLNDLVNVFSNEMSTY